MTKQYLTPTEHSAQYNARQREQFKVAYDVVIHNGTKGRGLPPFSEIVAMLNDAMNKKGTIEYATPQRDANGLIQSIAKEIVPAAEVHAYQLVGVIGAICDLFDAATANAPAKTKA